MVKSYRMLLCIYKEENGFLKHSNQVRDFHSFKTSNYREKLIKEFLSILSGLPDIQIKRLWNQPINAWIRTITYGSM